MKRSQLNEIILDAAAFARSHDFYLPQFAHWALEDWRNQSADLGQFVARRLGWDITDFGLGDFAACGLIMFTIRNGDPARRAGTQVYAEKLLVVDVDQITPLHFHWAKMEDIINRGGGSLVVQLYNSTPEGGLDTTDVEVYLDGVTRRVKAGGSVVLYPGDSITLTTGLYHAFWGEGRRVLVGEVSSVNDDAADNRFHDKVGRFPQIEEDVLPARLLVNDYERFLDVGS
jgi:D-lyxose ketol-isomerase